MGLMIADPDVAADLDLEDLDQDSLCTCDCGPGEHSSAGCQGPGCLCPATWDGLGAEDLEDVELEADAVRVTAVLVAARKLRKKLEQDRQERAARDPASLPRKPKVTTKLKAPRKIAPPTPSADALPSYEDDGRIHFEEDPLEAVLAG